MLVGRERSLRGRARPGSIGTSARSRAAFTLIELMVVVVILGLMGGIAFVSWEAIFPSQQFNSAIHRLSDLLHSTRSEAIARNRQFRLYYDIEHDEYWVRTPYRLEGGIATPENDEDDYRTIEHTQLEKEGMEILEVMVEDEIYDDGLVYINFDPLGASSYHTVVIRHKLLDRVTTIEALPLTGDIRFHDGLFEREFATEKDFE